VEAKLVLAGTVIDSPNRDRHLIRVIAKAHLWLAELACGNALTIDELAKQQNEDSGEVSRFLPLAYLAPDIIEKILEGKQPVDLTAERLRRMPLLPHAWNEQRERLGFAG
jgi:hypothetical protein